MRPSLWFVVPVHGRLELAAICLRQLRRSCDWLTENGVDATAVTIGTRHDIDALDGFGFATVEYDTVFTSDKFNDGIQFACDPAVNPRPADFVVPFGSDDWIDPAVLLPLPAPNEMIGFQRMAFVREDGRVLSSVYLKVMGGCGIRIYPRQLMEPLGYRPAEPDRERGCDTSILTNLKFYWGDQMKIMHRHAHDLQIVDWKSNGQQLNGYDNVVSRHRPHLEQDPFSALAGVYPEEALAEMAAHYSRTREPVAA